MSSALPYSPSPPPTYDGLSRSTSYMTTTLTPYLQLPHLLSLTWLAYPILSLVFVAFRLQLSLASSQDAVATAKDNLLASCKAAEQSATSAASMPRYMALATNQQFADAVNGSMNAARAALILALTAMEAIINFIVDLYRSTFLCFLELVVRGGLAILIAAVQELNQLVQNLASGLRTSIQNDITAANKVINGAIDAINKVNPFGDITAPQITIPSLDGLQNVTLPSSFEDSLNKLNASIPSVADLKDKIEAVIDTPFEALKKDINDTFSGISFDPSTLSVPAQNRLAFCSDLDMSVVDDVGRDLIKTAKIGIIILIAIALVLVGLNCLLTWYKWRCMKSHLEYTRQAWMTDPTMYHSRAANGMPQMTLSDHNLLMLQTNTSHPLLTRIANQISARLRLSPSKHIHLQWFFNYVFHPPALACFLIGFFGILCIEVQLLAMGPLVARYQDRAASTASDFSNAIATSINSSMYNQSSAYANDVNGRVDLIQNQINDGVFGWVNETTTVLNSTISEFYSDIQSAVTTVFGGTILESPANEFIKCFIGSKVDAIETALTFLHDNLKVDMPRVNQSVLVLSPDSVNEASAPIAAAALGGGNNDNGGLIIRLVNSYAESLKKERVMFGIFLGLWGFVVLMAICIILWHSYGRAWIEKRQKRRWETEQRSGLDGIFIPSRGSSQLGNEKGTGTLTPDIPAFTPLPSPRGLGFNPFSFGRSSSLNLNNEANSRSVDSSLPNSQKAWDGTDKKHSVQEASKSQFNLMGLGRKAFGKDRTKKDVKDLPGVDASSITDQQTQEGDNRNTAWFGRFVTILGRKEQKRDSDYWENEAGRGRPQLRISIDSASSINDNNSDERALNSRWSSSPVEPQGTTPWMDLVNPSPKRAPAPTSTPALTQRLSPPAFLPIRPPKHRHNASVPTDVGPTFDDSDPLVESTPLALPLHHGFSRNETDSINSSASRPRPPRPPRSSRPRDLSPPPPLKSPRMLQPQRSLAPPPERHRRTSSVPGWKYHQEQQQQQAFNPRVESLTPVSRLLTNTHARQSSSVDPFVTPFDDEHRVTIRQPSSMRKSIPTNPFAGVAV